MASSQKPETFRDRKQSAIKTLAKVAKWPHCGHYDEIRTEGVNDFHYTIETSVKLGKIPEFVRREDRYSDEREYRYDTYDWQIFAQSIAELSTADFYEVHAWKDDWESKDNPITATDGSRGQWEASRTAKVKTAEWLLEGDD